MADQEELGPWCWCEEEGGRLHYPKGTVMRCAKAPKGFASAVGAVQELDAHDSWCGGPEGWRIHLGGVAGWEFEPLSPVPLRILSKEPPRWGMQLRTMGHIWKLERPQNDSHVAILNDGVEQYLVQAVEHLHCAAIPPAPAEAGPWRWCDIPGGRWHYPEGTVMRCMKSPPDYSLSFVGMERALDALERWCVSNVRVQLGTEGWELEPVTLPPLSIAGFAEPPHWGMWLRTMGRAWRLDRPRDDSHVAVLNDGVAPYCVRAGENLQCQALDARDAPAPLTRLIGHRLRIKGAPDYWRECIGQTVLIEPVQSHMALEAGAEVSFLVRRDGEQQRCGLGLVNAHLWTFEKATEPKPAIRADKDRRVAYDHESFVQELDVAVRDIRDLLVEKNRAYGNSALDPVRIFSKASLMEQLFVRIDDKLSRLKRGEAAGEDVVLDLQGYLLLVRIAQRREKKEHHGTT